VRRNAAEFQRTTKRLAFRAKTHVARLTTSASAVVASDGPELNVGFPRIRWPVPAPRHATAFCRRFPMADAEVRIAAQRVGSINGGYKAFAPPAGGRRVDKQSNDQ
jgi:hypothetical protein